MRIKFLVCIFFASVGCTLFPSDDYQYLPYSENAALLRDYTYLSHTSTSVTYEVTIHGLAWYGGDVYLTQDEMSLEGQGTFEILDFSGVNYNLSGSSSTVLLIDQSGSYLEIDPYNNRSKALNKFLEDFGPHNQLLVGAFSKSGKLETQPVEYPTDEFSTPWVHQKYLFDLAGRTGGSNALYDAIDNALDKLILNSGYPKNLVVMVHASDAGSTATVSSLIAKANQYQVKVHIIVFGPEPAGGEVWELVDKTNGMMAICSTDSDLITVFNNFQYLLNSNVTANRLRIRFTPSSGTVVSNNEYENLIKITDKYSGYEFNPVYVKITIP
jgi:hypothetical protein